MKKKLLMLLFGGCLIISLTGCSETSKEMSEKKNIPQVKEAIETEDKQEKDQNIKTDNEDNNLSKINCLTKVDLNDTTNVMEYWNLFYNKNTNKLTKVINLKIEQINTSNYTNSQLVQAENTLKEYYNGLLENAREINNNNDFYRGLKKEVKYDKNTYSVSTSTIIDIENSSDEYLKNILLEKGGAIGNNVDEKLILDVKGFLEYTNNNGFVCEIE
ncbi:MAG: hypothetical protein HFI73_07135 [Bacilli bacterium]|jgi:hypothetical protein|nr:hypothetical protein [Bacilli bacterium]